MGKKANRHQARNANAEIRELIGNLAEQLRQAGLSDDTVAVAIAGAAIIEMCRTYGEHNARKFLQYLFDGNPSMLAAGPLSDATIEGFA